MVLRQFLWVWICFFFRVFSGIERSTNKLGKWGQMISKNRFRVEREQVEKNSHYLLYRVNIFKKRISRFSTHVNIIE